MNVIKYIPFPIKVFFSRQKRVIICKWELIRYPNRVIYVCPCCGVKLKSFISLNFDKRSDIFNPERYKNTNQEVICPICRSLPRHRILAEWFEEHKDEIHGNILYFAAESSMKLWLKRNRIKFTTADLYTEADLKLDIEDTHQPDESWDWVICNHVLEHVDDYRKALKEIYRILKPGGTLICSFPILESLDTLIEETEHTEENKKKRLQLYGQADHLRIFGRDSDEILRQAGFEVSLIEGNTMPDKIYPVIGPADYDVNYLFVCRKPM